MCVCTPPQTDLEGNLRMFKPRSRSGRMALLQVLLLRSSALQLAGGESVAAV